MVLSTMDQAEPKLSRPGTFIYVVQDPFYQARYTVYIALVGFHER